MMSKYPEKCHVAGCPCREWSAKSPSESPATPERDAGFLVPEAKNVPQGDSGAGMTTCRDCQGSGAGDGLAGVCPYCGGSGQVETYEARQQRLALVAPTFTEEWESAPRAMIRYVEQSIAEYWFLRGVRAGEAGAIVTMNEDLREIKRVAEERL